MKIFDDYANFIKHHMKSEEANLFPYVDKLLHGNIKENYDIETFSKHHAQTGDKIKELKSIIIKYLPSDSKSNHLLTATLYDIFNLEELLKLHTNVEDMIFMPAVKHLEEKKKALLKNAENPISTIIEQTADNGELLSDREKDVIVGVV